MLCSSSFQGNKSRAVINRDVGIVATDRDNVANNALHDEIGT